MLNTGVSLQKRTFKSIVFLFLLLVGQLSLALDRGNCDRLIKGVARVEVATNRSEVRKALLEIGVKPKDIKSFFNKEVVQFEFPTRGGDPVLGFLRYEQGKLISQLFSIKNENHFGAIKAFGFFRKHSVQLADRLGVQKIEIQGGSVFNDSVVEFLVGQGFKPKKIPLPPGWGKGEQEVYFKTMDLYVPE